MVQFLNEPIQNNCETIAVLFKSQECIDYLLDIRRELGCILTSIAADSYIMWMICRGRCPCSNTLTNIHLISIALKVRHQYLSSTRSIKWSWHKESISAERWRLYTVDVVKRQVAAAENILSSAISQTILFIQWILNTEIGQCAGCASSCVFCDAVLGQKVIVTDLWVFWIMLEVLSKN